MKWYINEMKKALDYSKPIKAISKGLGFTYLLLPQIEPHSYKVIGYNWFNVDSGEYNSAECWKTPEEAIKYYSADHKIINCTVRLIH